MTTTLSPGPAAERESNALRDTALGAPDADASPQRRHVRSALALVAFWSVPALLVSSITALERPEVGLPRAFLMYGLPWYFWAGITPTIARLGRRYRFDGEARGRAIAAHVAAGLAAGLLQGVTSVGAQLVFGTAATQPRDSGALTEIAFWMPFGLLFYGATLSVAIAMDNQRRLRERDVLASRMRAQLVEARLGALRMQLQPHFLFNALNTVAMLVRQGESQNAVRMLARLSDLLRTLLDDSGGQEVPLEEELTLLAKYMEIEQVRFADRLTFRTHVPADVLAALVPAFLLQPLAENAVRHGVARSAAAGAIVLEAARSGAALTLRLRNDGPALPADWSMAGSARIGLRNTAARLRHLYGGAGTVHVANADEGGVEVRIAIPYHTQAMPPVPADA